MGKLIARILRQLSSLIARGDVTLVNDDESLQLLQIIALSDEPLSDIERYQDYGYTSKPFPGAQHVTLFPNGSRSHGLCIKVDDRRYRLTGLADGEVALYDDQGQTVHLRRDGIYIVSAQQVVFDTPQALFTGDVGIDGQMYVAGDIDSDANINATGDVSDGTSSMQDMRDIYNVHTNPANGSSPPPQQM